MGMLQSVETVSAADVPQPPVKVIPPKKAANPFPFFFINDNRLTFAYAPDGASPGFPGRTPEMTFAFTHFDAWNYGTNLINVGLVKYSQHAPASPCTVSYQGCAGSVLDYASIRSTFGFNEIFDTKLFTAAPLRNVSLEVGADRGMRDVASALNVTAVTAGLQFAFDLPYKGFLNVAPLVYKEWIYSGTITPFGPFRPGVPDGVLEFRPTWAVEANYYMDLGFLPETIPLAVSGRMLIIGEMGSGYPAGALPSKIFVPSATQIYTEPVRLTLDASKLLWGKTYSHALDLWVAYKWNQNVLGLNHETSPSCIGGACTASTVYTGVTVKF
ncbi:hypothetical protein [Bradyrhizobium sp. STM 3561]|uniref:hypothetical protein n=1 Tax=unclassified Bradyrhizobium TaxID=2631580 RepID=UPI00388F9987